MTAGCRTQNTLILLRRLFFAVRTQDWRWSRGSVAGRGLSDRRPRTLPNADRTAPTKSQLQITDTLRTALPLTARRASGSATIAPVAWQPRLFRDAVAPFASSVNARGNPAPSTSYVCDVVLPLASVTLIADAHGRKKTRYEDGSLRCSIRSTPGPASSSGSAKQPHEAPSTTGFGRGCQHRMAISEKPMTYQP